MKFPGTEKFVPAFSQIVLACVLAAVSPASTADAGSDFQRGLDAYRAGDITGAMTPLKAAADAGHAEAQALYGGILDSAEFDEEAAAYLGKAAEQNNAEGQYGLAKLYVAGEAKAPNDAEAGKLMRAAAAQGHDLANISLALAYINRDARLGASNPDVPEAGQYILKAAELGELRAVEVLANAYRTGEYGLATDPSKADQWARQLSSMLGQPPKKGGKK